MMTSDWLAATAGLMTRQLGRVRQHFYIDKPCGEMTFGGKPHLHKILRSKLPCGTRLCINRF